MKTIVFASLLLAVAAQAQIPETFQRLWNDPAVAGRIERDIEKYRKGDTVIEVVGKDGKPLANATVEVRQQTHGFLFGCNLFVLDQLATPELNRKYEAAFTNLFNFATLPFYWRDLEPEPGKPRFAEDSPRIWRRPPPDRLVKWCKANGITPKGHALMYAKNKFMPDWTARDDAET
ncbi:MAG: glycoside hydrolase family 10, partial [Verrucomicrobia bacterium]|nr:glycoside hydrolase family 10 [Verrucomicrobiota bacterium]